MPPDYSIPGLRIDVKQDSPEPMLLVRSSGRQPEWRIFHLDVVNRIGESIVPTAFIYQGVLWQAISETDLGAGGLYEMRAWPENEPVFQRVVLEREDWLRNMEEQRTFRKQVELAHWSRYYGWLLGWLPARFQDALAEKWHFSPVDASKHNGYVVAALACAPIPSLMGSFALIVIITIGIAELLRGFHAGESEEPCGFLLFELADRLVGRFFVSKAG